MMRLDERVGGLARTLLLLSLLPAVSVAGAIPDLPRLDSSALVHEGSFWVPGHDRVGADLTFGGYALGIDPVHHGLYFGCHDYLQRLAEVAIPPLGETAPVLQDCTDVTQGRLPQVDDYLPRLGGTLRYADRLIVSAFGDYDADLSQTRSHFATSPDFANTAALVGPLQVGDRAGFVSGYMGMIPAEWREAFGGPALTGQCCINIISRSSAGPAASVFDPADLGAVVPVPARMLVGYPLEHALAEPASQNPWFNHTTRIAGLAFPSGSRSLLFIGRHGTGPYCYDTAEVCGDPADPYKGPHAYPYVHQIWAYDALDLLRVKAGELQAWDLRPYAVWHLPEMDQTGAATLSGATYDADTGRLYVTEGFGEDADRHRVHVYRIAVPVVGGVLTGLAAQGYVGTNNQMQFGAFTIQGDSRRVLIRGLGPALDGYVPNAIRNPKIALSINGAPTPLEVNDDWADADNADEIATLKHQPKNEKESAILRTLEPGIYNVHLSGSGGTEGIGMFQVYAVEGGGNGELKGLAAQGQVGTNNQVQFGAFTITGAPRKVLIRGLGPALDGYVPGAIGDPKIALSLNGALAPLEVNDDWADADNVAEIMALKHQPKNPTESAILRTLEPGIYNVHLSGSGGSTGIGMFQVYAVE